MSGALRTFLLLGPNAALGADEHQWILYRAEQPVSYVRSTKAVLVRCIREKSIELSVEGKAALDALADDFNAWKADPAGGVLLLQPKHVVQPKLSMLTLLEGLGVLLR